MEIEIMFLSRCLLLSGAGPEGAGGLGIGPLALIQFVFLLILSLASLGVAITFAIRPSERRLSLLRPLSLGLVFSALGMLCAGAAISLSVAAGSATFPDGPSVRLLLAGLAEAVLPASIAFAALALVWALATIGFHRLK